MEWVETTGRTVDDAKDSALDELGVDEQEAEFEVLEEPRPGLFGRLRGEARVRARVRPTQPRPKQDRRERRRRGERSGGEPRKRGRSGRGARSAPDRAGPAGAERVPEPDRTAAPAQPAATPAAPGPAPAGDGERQGRPADPARRRRRRSTPNAAERLPAPAPEETTMTESDLTEQGEVVKEFLDDLLDAFDLDGEVGLQLDEGDDAVELAITGEDLGLLIGPKGQTLQAIQELSRSVLQRQRPGETHARVRVDVAGYRERRREALERFARQVADQVLESGTPTELEPMAPPDRKVVHDTINEIEGVTTSSEGEEPRRRVVIRPA